MSVSSIMNTGLKGMSATQLATQVSANNVANAATVGYTRRTVAITPDHALIGGSNAQRVVEPFIQKRLLSSQASAGEAGAERMAVEVLDSVFAEGDGSIGSALDAFQVSMQDLSARPEDPAMRQQVLSTANNLASAFGNASAQIAQARADANLRVTEDLAEVNQRLEQIGRLGTEIQQSEGTGVEASELRDQRDQLVRQVAERVPVTTMDYGNGRIGVNLGGHQLVSIDGVVSGLSARPAEDGALRIEKFVAGARVDLTEFVKSGSVGGQLNARAGALAEAEQRLDQLAADVADGYNAVHQKGVGLDGVGDRRLFDVGANVRGAASAFAVSADVAGAPRNIGAASSADSLPADNRNALALAALANAPLASGGVSVNDALAALIGFAGAAVQSATQAERFSSGALEQVDALRENVSGVSTDEEMVAMMKYQRAYEATLKVIQTADQMLSDLLQIRG